MARRAATRRMGLRLTLGGAPAAPHALAGVPGLYRPDVPTPVGGEGELPLGDAERLAADPGVPLELVDLEDPAAAAAQAEADLAAARQGVAAMTRMGPEGSEPDRVRQEAEAVAPRPATTEPAAAGSDQEG